MAQAQRDAACQRILDETPANITDVNVWYERVKLARRSNPALRGRLSEGHYIAMIGILRKHINETPGLSDGEIEADEDIIDMYENNRRNMFAIDLVKNPMYIQFNHSGGANLRSVSTYNAPGGAVPVQVLHWTTIREDIGHLSTMRNLQDSGITIGRNRSFTKRIFEANCIEPDANTFFGDHSGIRSIKDSVLPDYCADQFDSHGDRFDFYHELCNIRPLYRADYAMKWDDEVIIVFEIKAPDGMQSAHLNRAGVSHGNLVSGYYGVNYNPNASQDGSDVYTLLTRLQRQALVASRGVINNTTVDIQLPAGKQYIQKSVQQIAGYMVAFQRKYAVLSTCEVTWLLKMEDDGRLFTSPGIFGDDDSSTNSPTCLLMSFILHARDEALNNNGAHKLVIDPNSRFYDYLDGCWTLSRRRNDEDIPVSEHKRKIVDEMRQAWFAIQQAQLDDNGNNGNNGNNGGGGGGPGHGQGPGNGAPPVGQPPLPPPANNGGHGVEGNAAYIPGNVINQLNDTLISSENLITNKKDGTGYRRLVAIDMLPLERVCIGFPWELTEVHPSADDQVGSSKMTIAGIPLILKFLDPKFTHTKSLFFNELQMYYGSLRSLQGLCAPYLFYGGKFTQGRQIIVTSREGAPLEGMPPAVLKQKSVHSAMRKAISTLHDHGILHGTINLGAFHMVISNDKMRIYVTDYGMACDLPKHTQESVHLFSNEMSKVEEVISEISISS